MGKWGWCGPEGCRPSQKKGEVIRVQAGPRSRYCNQVHAIGGRWKGRRALRLRDKSGSEGSDGVEGCLADSMSLPASGMTTLRFYINHGRPYTDTVNTEIETPEQPLLWDKKVMGLRLAGFFCKMPSWGAEQLSCGEQGPLRSTENPESRWGSANSDLGRPAGSADLYLPCWEDKSLVESSLSVLL